MPGAKPDAIQLVNLTKRFGQVTANNRVNLSVRAGEIMALLGENGSGKTTLMNMLSGLYRPDSGSVLVAGKPASIHSPGDAIALGIGMVHQHFKLVDVMSVAENIVLGAGARVAGGAGERRMRELAARYGFTQPLTRKVYALSVGEKQTVEILKVLYRDAKVLILDEPTAVLTPQEAQRLFAVLRAMRDDGCAVIIITHKLDEVMDVADRITVLRKGESVATVEKRDVSIRKLAELMVGRPVDLTIERPEAPEGGVPGMGRPLLRVRDLTVLGDSGAAALSDVCFELRKGEILGIAGVAGSGQKELCEAIAGLMKCERGDIEYVREDGAAVSLKACTPRDIIKLGVSMSFIPEDRLGMGLVAGMDIVDNLLLKDYASGRLPVIRRKRVARRAQEMIAELQIVTPGIHTQVRKLSGGNVQKVLLGREIHSGPRLLITAYPVRGLDIHSSYTIYGLLQAQKMRGVGVLYIGEDLDVLISLCDRILVLCDGRCMAVLPAAEATKEQLGLYMTRAHAARESEGAADA